MGMIITLHLIYTLNVVNELKFKKMGPVWSWVEHGLASQFFNEIPVFTKGGIYMKERH